MIDFRALPAAFMGGECVVWAFFRAGNPSGGGGRREWPAAKWRPLIVATLASCFCGQAMAGKLNASAMKTGGHYDQFIVKFVRNSREAGDAKARQQRLDVVGRANGLQLKQFRHLAVGADVVKSNLRLGHAAALRMMQQLAHDPSVEYVELDAIRTATFTPNDPGYASQWHYYEPTAGINLPAAWAKANGSGSVVAVIDTGIAPHSDLSPNVVAGYDFISDATMAGDGSGRDSNPNDVGDWVTADQCSTGSSAENSSWHGTHVAGTVAALTNNGVGVAGVAFNARVMPLRVLGHCGGYSSDIADAIVWASGGTVTGVPVNANPAEVINLSLGGVGACDNTTQSAIDHAFNAGTVVVVSAGNSNEPAANQAPANCANVITVAAIGRGGGRASYSNFGSAVDVSAPGGDGSDGILSTINLGTTTQGAQGYAYYQGTSMAAPHVAGTVALMQSLRSRTPAAIETILKGTARGLPLACPEGCGTGIIDASLALYAAAQTVRGDIFWRNTVTGSNTVWKAANSTNFQTLTAVSDLAWKVVGIGDFNADAKFDVLWRNSNTGANTIWRSSNSAAPQAVTAVTDPSWRVVAVGDFDGEGHADILWRNASTGANVIWKSANSATTQPVTSVTSQAWQVAGAADFDRDGQADVLWHNASTGANVIWRSAKSATLQSVTGVTDPSWRIAGLGDFNGDSKADILWHNDATGASAIWCSANSSVKLAVATLADLHWKVAAVADYNADGKADILWRNDLTGANTIWRSGLASTPQTVTPIADVHWSAIP